MTRPETPKDLADAGYRIEFGEPGDYDDFPELAGRFWWTWSRKGCGVEASTPEWGTADEAIADARRDQAENLNIERLGS
jgi:hypothetical protein